MSSISDTFLQCCFRYLNVHQADPEKARDLSAVIQALDLNTTNLSVALIFVYKYQHNSINSLAFDKSDSLPYFIIIASLILSNKYLNDQSYTLKTWQGVLGKYSRFDMSLGMLNQLEQNVLASMDYALNVKHQAQLWDKLGDLDEAHIATLRYHVGIPGGGGPSEYWRHDEHAAVHGAFSTTTPPLLATLNTSPMTYASNASYNSTPNMGGPVTPVSLAGPGAASHAYFPMYTSPTKPFASSHLAPFPQVTPVYGAMQYPGLQVHGWDPLPASRIGPMAMHMAPEMPVFPGPSY